MCFVLFFKNEEETKQVKHKNSRRIQNEGQNKWEILTTEQI